MLEEIQRKQQVASNPLNSVWVSASAGSGKTKVLTDRVLNLLLSDTEAEKILCLTFTKAAAAEMSNRINETLKSWAILSDKELTVELQKLNGLHPTSKILKKARCLFIKVLEAPGGMKIMTIHSFCQSVLKRFPIEAGISPQFEVIDETKSHKLLQTTIQQTFTNSLFKKDISVLSDYFDEKAIHEIFKMILANQSKLNEIIQEYPQINLLENKLKEYFNLKKYHSEKEIINENFNLDEFEEGKLLFLTKDQKKILQKEKDNPKAHCLMDTLEKVHEWELISITTALMNIIKHIIQNYMRMKKEESFLDYADLISITKNLLQNTSMALWVLFKLDGGIDHILVDEAQDTNPDQWQIIRLISEEFFSGIGRETKVVRTIFAVGDKKQSIFSFQGADPTEFERMHVFFKERASKAQKKFETIPLNISFRSTPAVLEIVNYLLKNPSARKGILQSDEEAYHIAFREKDSGLVEIWPLETAEQHEKPSEWSFPESIKVQSPITKLAQKIASKIKQMIISKEILKSKGRPIEPSDFMILVRKRSKIVSELLRALKEKNIPVAGVDRLMLTDHIAVQDLINVAKFVLLPEDDLNLACLLKSPLVKLSEEELFKLAHDRKEKSLWEQVQKYYPAISEKLKIILNKSDNMPVFEFFSYLLGPLKGREAFISRLGNEVNEALDEFLTLTLNFEQTEIPSLQNFLKWIIGRNIEIKRDLDQSNINAVRIMTIHGSKGLQGNIVFLPDTRTVPTIKDTFIWTESGLPLWIARSYLKTSHTDFLFDKIQQLQTEEYNRLLYVALTRAQDRLYICGWENKTTEQLEKKSEFSNGNWYDLIKDSLPNNIQPDKNGIIRIESNQKDPIKYPQKPIVQKEEITLPQYLFQIPTTESPLSKPLVPSKLHEEEIFLDSILGIDQAYAMRRGTFIHQLLQYLPEISPQNRIEAAIRLKPKDIEIPENLFLLFQDKKFQLLFGEDSLSEVPVAGIIDGKVISGQVDRLVITNKEVLIVDFKSGRHPPKTTDNVPPAYKTQLKIYKCLLKDIFPDKVIRTFLLWTENLTLMEINHNQE